MKDFFKRTQFQSEIRRLIEKLTYYFKVAYRRGYFRLKLTTTLNLNDQQRHHSTDTYVFEVIITRRCDSCSMFAKKPHELCQ